jgi:hypothetical protein
MIDDRDECACGHVRDEHGPDDEAPHGLRCHVSGCDCIHFDEVEHGEG